VVVYDHSFSGNRAWFRFAFKWTDAKTGEAQSRAGMQAYRIADGKTRRDLAYLVTGKLDNGRMLSLKNIGRVRHRSSNGAA
jgi:hypothetical protein